MPTDLGQYARNVIERIGKPFETYRVWPSIVTLPRPAGNTIPLLPNNRPQPPQPSYRLVGSLLRASERLVKGRDARADGLFGNGHGKTDAQITGDNRRTITSLTVALTLENPNGVAVRGATAVYRINVERSELNRSVSVYVGGSGIGGGTKITITQDSGDALYDAIAVSVMHLLGNALLVPYYRCGSMFTNDGSLDDRVRDALNRLTRTELEQNVKRYLFADGYSLDMRGPDLTAVDRAIVVLEMRRRSLQFDNRTGMVEFAMQLWKSLDYGRAAKRVADRMALSAQSQREKLEKEAREQTEHVVSPTEFGWPPLVRVVLLDLSRITDTSAQDRILAALRGCTGCDEIRAHPTKMLLGIRISWRPLEMQRVEIQRALRGSSLRLEYIWFNTPSPRLLIVPAKGTPPIG